MLRIALPLLLLAASGCIPKKKFDALQAEYDSTKTSLNQQLDATRAELDAARRRGVDLETALEAEKRRAGDLGEQLGRLNNEKAALLKDKSALKSSVEEMQTAMSELSARKAEADRRVAEYKNLLSRFKALIDAGKLRVKIVDGKMVVELATDVLFDSGSAALSEAGKAAIVEVSKILVTIPGRQYQVEGHTDNVPIKTSQFPSNWELAFARSLTVVKTMIDAGMPAPRVGAVSYGEFHPVHPNDSTEHKAANRRIEIVVMPDLSLLPGFSELEKMSKAD